MERQSAFRYVEIFGMTMLTNSGQSMSVTELYDDRDESSIWYKDLFPDLEFIESKLLCPPARIGFRYTVQVVSPEIFLPWLASKLTKRGTRLVQRHVESLDQARKLADAEIVINATGLGAAELANDDKVYPVRGQTMFVKSDFNRAVLFQGVILHLCDPTPSSGGVILGDISQVRNTSTVVDAETKKDILRRTN